jgi:lipopolysaccharide/colanic/teichoic acid biosynthesis glycosyltransferase
MARIFDSILSVVALMIFFFPICIISLLIKGKEKQAVLFVQERVGLQKQPFVILKFQTLKVGVPTWTGRILRKTGLDELPQFINVLKGDMSIVGPRALTEEDVSRLGWDDEYHAERWQVKPGITGLAQIYGGQHKKISWFWDKQYLEKKTILFDFLLIIVSFLMNIFGKTRVRRKIWPNKDLK